MIKAYQKYWKKALKFNGYSSRKDYWWVFLVNTIIFAILSFIRTLITLPMVAKIIESSKNLSREETVEKTQALSLHPTGAILAMVILSAILGAVILIPNTTLVARRLKDAALPNVLAYLFAIAAFYGIISPFIGEKGLGVVSTVASILTLLIYILCLFPSKYRDDEDDDSRNYD
ncbi:DUF805 domain-containing protein [Lactococcus hircilactis]|uniref:DUF805 domain-containing protein n=1 Tax=Lactococcus hircilactis TaxID=1494462 RepID=A0A7X1Z913_9LACT|nr:DUF805 domain-containing protein [Lactococcus hircilactis]MQW39927.1 DUF805 domain-containing protein [Lactococcus hircilactis]